ncbi:hypothetical protein [Haloarchaeobius sp. DFWS5]|uniref:hypothetical protein n=1 Tax=Haloarchaeobius sp. DFWS5 TaxID=3446114 RepID=UPI003EBCAC0C
MSSEYNRNESKGPKSVRERIIEHAQLQCYEARSELQQAQMLNHGTAPRQVRMKLQQAISDYYHALRPLRNRPEVGENDWWETVELSDDWMYTETVPRREVVGSIDEQLGIREWTEDVEQSYAGLDVIRDLERAVETTTVVKTGMRGRREDTVTRVKILDGDILVDIVGVLHEAAGRLGFQPDMTVPDAETEAV